jgi:hypothetical protein
MAGVTSTSPANLLRSNLWSSQLKDVLYADLQGVGYVDWMSDFPDGTTFNIPSIGQLQVDNYVEDTPVKYRALNTGNFTFTITEYLSSATYITEKDRQDSFYASAVESQFVPKEHRAIMERLETDILKLGMSQTASDPNSINGADHRWVGTGDNQTMSVQDFAKALYSLKKANVPATDLIAIVDPSVEFKMNTLTNLVNMSNNPRWEGIINDGIASGMKFVKNIYGFDVYTSQFLADANETIVATGSGSDVTAAGKCNMFFSASGIVKPFKGAWRQMPKVDSSYNKDYQREEYVTTCRYGLKLFRPENLVCVLTDTDQV